MTRTQTRFLRGGAAVLLTTLTTSGGCSRDGGASAGARPPQALPVVVAHAQRRDFPEKLEAIGLVEPAASVLLKPQIEGKLLEAKFVEGQEVKAGELMLVVDPRPFEAALHMAEANLAKAKAVAGDAARQAEQMKTASRGSAASTREVDQAQAAADAAQAEVLASQARVELAQLALEYCSIRAPITGRTGTLLVKPGTVLKANETELVEVSQIAPINVAFSVPERHLGVIRARQAQGPLRVEATVPDNGGPSAVGELTFIDSKVDSATGTIRLRATLPNDDRRLWPGAYVNAALTLGVQRGAVVVPSPAVQVGQKGTYVFVVKDGVAEERPVKVGRVELEETIIAEGLTGDETVVVDGQLRLLPGSKVEAREAKETAG
jgi:multidrug efflux system membrane fusion protein